MSATRCARTPIPGKNPNSAHPPLWESSPDPTRPSPRQAAPLPYPVRPSVRSSFTGRQMITNPGKEGLNGAKVRYDASDPPPLNPRDSPPLARCETRFHLAHPDRPPSTLISPDPSPRQHPDVYLDKKHTWLSEGVPRRRPHQVRRDAEGEEARLRDVRFQQARRVLDGFPAQTSTRRRSSPRPATPQLPPPRRIRRCRRRWRAELAAGGSPARSAPPPRTNRFSSTSCSTKRSDQPRCQTP